jgi:hypothetical protein
MTFDPDRRSDFDDPIRRRIAEGEGSTWVPALVGFAFLLGIDTSCSGIGVPRPTTQRARAAFS